MKNMKRMLAMLLALVMLLGLSCTTALAAAEEPEKAGLYAVTGSTGVTLTPKLPGKDGATVSGVSATIGGKSETFYEGAEQVEVTISGVTAGKYYMFFALTQETTTPPEGAIKFVDQATASGTVSCKVYPMDLSAGQTYYIYVSSNEESGLTALTKVGSFTYYEPYTLGDVDDDGYWTANDALYTLQIAVNRDTLTIDGESVAVTDTMRKAADTDKDTYITATDALLILQKAVGKDVF